MSIISTRAEALLWPLLKGIPRSRALSHKHKTPEPTSGKMEALQTFCPVSPPSSQVPDTFPTPVSCFLGKDLAPSGGGVVLWGSYSHPDFPQMRLPRNLPQLPHPSVMQPVGIGMHWNSWGLYPRQIITAKAEIPMFCNMMLLDQGQFPAQAPLGNI